MKMPLPFTAKKRSSVLKWTLILILVWFFSPLFFNETAPDDEGYLPGVVAEGPRKGNNNNSSSSSLNKKHFK